MEIQERKWYVGAVAEPALMRLTVKAPTKDGFGLVVLAEAARWRLEAERGLDLGSVDLQWTAGPRQVT